MRRNFLLICFVNFAFSQTGVFLGVCYQPSCIRHTNKNSLAFLLLIWWNNWVDYLAGKTAYYFSHPSCKIKLVSPLFIIGPLQARAILLCFAFFLFLRNFSSQSKMLLSSLSLRVNSLISTTNFSFSFPDCKCESI